MLLYLQARTFRLACDTAPVRTGEELAIDSLTEYLRARIEGAEGGIIVEQFPRGHSNLTYLLRTGKNSREYVLRRGPLGPVAPKAHDMAREFRLLQMVHPHFLPAPAVFLLCEDPAILGSVFFLMERRHGIILRESVPSELAALPNYPQLISESFIDCFARLHAIDVFKTGLVSLGKPEGFLARQVQGWGERWHRAVTDDMPKTIATKMDSVIRWLTDFMPVSPSPTLVHNDYKLDNVMLGPESPMSVAAILDWEMATVGDPLADVGLALCYWAWAQVGLAGGQAVPSLTSQSGWYTRDQFVQRYAQQTGRDLSQIGYYEVLGIFKLAVILQQIYYRFRRGQTSDPRFQDFNERVRALIELASTMTGKLA
jgi:aminoglycoside phosphotransferase (APT) family kinase protein